MDQIKIGKNRWNNFFIIWPVVIFTLGLFWVFRFRTMVKELKNHTRNNTEPNLPNENLGLIAWVLFMGSLVLFGILTDKGFDILNSYAWKIALGLFLTAYFLSGLIRFQYLRALSDHYEDNSYQYCGRSIQLADPDKTHEKVVGGGVSVMSTPAPAGEFRRYTLHRPRIVGREEFGGTGSILKKSFIPYTFFLNPFLFASDVQETMNRHWDFHRRSQDYMGVVNQ